MPISQHDNRHYLLRLWVPALVFCAIVGMLIIADLASGESDRSIPAVVGIVVAAIVFMSVRHYQKRRIVRMLQTEDPGKFIRTFAESARRIPHGSLLAAANAATILALYGRFGEAEHALESVSWRNVPPLLQAQESAA